MVLHINQAKNNSNMTWTALTSDGKIYSVAKVLYSRLSFEVHIMYCDDDYLRMLYVDENKRFKINPLFQIYTDIENDTTIGRIKRKTKIIGLFKSYIFYEYTINGSIYKCYEIFLKDEGLYLCIYRDDEIVAIIHKNPTDVNNKDVSVAYLLDEKYARIAIPCLICYDLVSYNCIFDRALYSERYISTDTIHKQLKSKYNSNFIQIAKQRKDD